MGEQLSSTPPGHTKLAVPTAILWGWLSSAVAAIIALVWFLLQLSFATDHRIIAADTAAGSAASSAKDAKDLAASQQSRIDALTHRIEQLEIWCAPRKP